MSEQRKLTLNVIVEQGCADWHWILDSLKGPDRIKGVKVCAVSDGWITEEKEDLLMRAHNVILKLEREL